MKNIGKYCWYQCREDFCKIKDPLKIHYIFDYIK